MKRGIMSRRGFLRATSGAAAASVSTGPLGLAGAEKGNGSSNAAVQPWYRRALRWGQTNITERDPPRYDISWWRQYWRRTRAQGVIVNAGGIVAYYPSRFHLQKKAQFLGERDLFGEIVRAAREEGLAVLARMDSNRAAEELFRAHSDWFAVDAAGRPYRAGDLYVTCINGPYYRDYLPGILAEIIERYRPDGFTDNSWSGLGRNSVCYCAHCASSFKDKTGHDLPREHNWDAPAYRKWIGWSYARRIELWDSNNRVTRTAGGPDCIWVGMNSGSIVGQCQTFRDYREICARAQIVMLDHQARSDAAGFQQNGETGKLIHGLLGWDKLIPESMAMYQAGRPTFRLSAKPAAEARLWMIDGFAGGLQPWWHHVGAWHEDRRAYRTVEPLNRWHQANAEFLVNRRPIATVGVVWSQQNTDFYGRDKPEELTEMPWRGMTQALIRARIPYLPVHADHIDRDAGGLTLLILPNLAAMSDAQVGAVRRFVAHGGGLLATGESSATNEWGELRPDFALADLFGAHAIDSRAASTDRGRARWAGETQHTYLRLSPERIGRVDGPRSGDEPPDSGQRHPVLAGFEETDILPFGGVLEPLRVQNRAVVPLTFVPSFPIYPPETAWMRQPRTDIPALVVSEAENSGRVVFLPADLDRRFARDNLPDHGDLLTNLVRWAARHNFPLKVAGPGLIDCHLYEQAGRLILHLVNLTSTATWRAPIHELLPVGPLSIEVKLPQGTRGDARALVSDVRIRSRIERGWAVFTVPSLADHEVVVID